MSRSFIIRPPKWLKSYYLAITTVSVLGVIVFLILYFTKILSLAVSLTLGVICFLFIIAGIVALVAYSGEKLYFKDGIYYCKTAFKKAQTAELKEIAVVDIIERQRGFSIAEVTFYSKDKTPLIKFKADGWVFKKNIFLTSLEQNHIEVNKQIKVR